MYTVEEVVEKLRTFKTKEEREEFLQYLKEHLTNKIFDEVTEQVKQNNEVEPPEIVLDNTSAQLHWKNSNSVIFSKNGNIACNSDELPKINQNLLEKCFAHIVGLHIKENNSLKNVEVKEKTRFIHSSNKKAFVAGMIVGRNECK